MQLDPETVDNLDAYNHIPPQLMEKCAALSVRPDTVKNLVQSMQGEQNTKQTGAGVACKPSAVASSTEDAGEALAQAYNTQMLLLIPEPWASCICRVSEC